MLSLLEFGIAKNIALGKITKHSKISAGYPGEDYHFDDEEKLRETLASLEAKGYIDDFKLTESGEKELSNHKVENAIILAAGGDLSSKEIYSLPRGLYKVEGEVIIERQINQLKEIGISNIYVIVGIKKEMYFYLEDKCDVTLISSINPRKNSIVSLHSIAEKLGNSYICSCDNYFTENPFEPYVYDTFHATSDRCDSSYEYSIKKNSENRITSLFITTDGTNECLFGHAYFSKNFSDKFRLFLDKEINSFRVDSMFWQEFYAKHIIDLDMFARKYKKDYIWEFDTIRELQQMDSMFIENFGAKSVVKICDMFFCKKEDIENVMVLNKGLSNIVSLFTIFDSQYVIRFPGIDSKIVFNREKEVIVQQLAVENGIDKTCLHIDETGLKISLYISNCLDINAVYYNDIDFMKRLVKKVQILHSIKVKKETQDKLVYNPIDEADKLIRIACETKGNLFELFGELREDIKILFYYTECDGFEKVISHNDINANNILMNDNSLELIDWEFAGFCDPGFDFGRIIDGYDFDDPSIDELLEVYFKRKPTFEERRHWISYVAIHAWYYFCWSLYKESIGEDVCYWMLYFYHRIKGTLLYALPLYKS